MERLSSRLLLLQVDGGVFNPVHQRRATAYDQKYFGYGNTFGGKANVGCFGKRPGLGLKLEADPLRRSGELDTHLDVIKLRDGVLKAAVDFYAWEDAGRPGFARGASGLAVRTVVDVLEGIGP